MDFITAAEVATLPGITADATLTRIVAAVEADFMRACGRDFIRESRVSYVAGYGPGVSYVFLPEWPIFAITEIRIDSTGVLDTDSAVEDLTEFVYESRSGKVIYTGGWFPEGDRVARFTYEAGYYAQSDTNTAHEAGKPPQDLRDALIEEAAVRYRRGGAEQFQSAAVSGGESFTRFREGRTDAFRSAVRRYRRA